jgi:archaellum component FlaC
MIAEQLGYLMISNIEQADIINKLKEKIARLEDEMKDVQDFNKQD